MLQLLPFFEVKVEIDALLRVDSRKGVAQVVVVTGAERIFGVVRVDTRDKAEVHVHLAFVRQVRSFWLDEESAKYGKRKHLFRKIKRRTYPQTPK